MNETYGSLVLRENSLILIYFKTLYIYSKRLFDLFISMIGCLFILPISIVVKLAYLMQGDLTSIFYTQERVGKNGKPIYIYKFRTMVKDANNFDKYFTPEQKVEFERNYKLNDDPRITKIGKLLRKTSLDEVPQFINVLKGDMSLIGPRPVVPNEIQKFGSKRNIVLSVLPGLTGWWACNGRSSTSYKKRVELETYYAKNISLFLDIKCFFRTIKVVIQREGAK